MRGLLTLAVTLLLLLPAIALYLSTSLGQSVAAPAPAPQLGRVSEPPLEPKPDPTPAPVQSAPAQPAQPAQSAPADSGLAQPASEPASEPAAPVQSAPALLPNSDSPAPPFSTRATSTSHPADWAKAPLLKAAVSEAMTDFPGEYSVVVQEVESGNRWAFNPDQRYHPASTIKMPVTLYTLEQYRAGKISWYDLIEYTPADFESPGGGAFETSHFGGLYPIENLVGRALRYSNNVAVNMLGRHFGWANIEAWTKTIGGDLYREGSSPRVTAMSELGWWLHLDKLSREDPQNAELLLQPLREVAYDGRITAGLPEGVPHLHKFGSYDGYYHDGGIIYSEKPYILIVLTHGARVDEADAAIARVAAAVHHVMVAE